MDKSYKHWKLSTHPTNKLSKTSRTKIKNNVTLVKVEDNFTDQSIKMAGQHSRLEDQIERQNHTYQRS